MKRVIKKIVVIFSILFIISILFSHLFIIVEANHDCIGEDCPICQTIQTVENAVKRNFGKIHVAEELFASLVGVVVALFLIRKVHDYYTLVDLKVKLTY